MHVRRQLLALLGSAPLVVLFACSATNGESVPEPVFQPPARDDAADTLPDPARPDGARPDATEGEPGDAGRDATPDAPVAPSPADVRIQELYVDHEGLGDSAEYVELRGAPGTPVGELRLRLLDANGGVDYEIQVGEVGDVIGDTATWVVGGNQVGAKLGVAGARLDRELSAANWGIANGRGAVQLVRGANRTLVDVVGYVNDPDGGAPAPPSTPPTATSEMRPALVPSGAKKAFGRKAAAADTEDNRADFCAMTPSPGSAQKPCD